ncbi:fimbrial protein [Cronobacter muytjensii]|uniref:fimbrial protein n=1 Tax=Cronobacter muytjensii TaxID=413501 RepID=UPI000575ECE1|nr:fimbrial protein [Cronobacter muytjensii]ALB69333.1 fimbrial protein [Cronobacter muytjensii ATCC 51329]ELY4670529.1 fimbrial protein [Cronobacter muytjensii]
MRNECIAMLLAGSSILTSALLQTARAEQTGDTMSVNFRGEFVMATACTINNDQVIDVIFGQVGVNKVNGTNYRQIIPFTVDCQGSTDDSSLSLTMSGTATGYDDAAVTTSADGLGIRIEANGQPLALNTPLETTLGALPSLKLTAVPVQDPVKTLAEGTFSATATLTASYQ